LPGWATTTGRLLSSAIASEGGGQVGDVTPNRSLCPLILGD